ncbi:MAG: protease modulator HflC, partial [Gallionellaceae bacterium]|nr:protease modulator HflC [Gallionellaceae bacterium]
MKLNPTNFLVGGVAVLILASMSLFVVDQRQTAIVFQLSEVIRVETTPGLKLKLPLIQNVRFFDSRILTMDAPEPERIITAEKKNMLVDSFVKWRIIDVKQYYISVGGDEARAQIRLMQTVNSAMREEFGKLTIHEVVSGKRDELMRVVQEKTDVDARKIGVEVLDVRL